MYSNIFRQLENKWLRTIGLFHKYLRGIIRGPRDVRKYKFIDLETNSNVLENEEFLFDLADSNYANVRFPVENPVRNPSVFRKISFETKVNSVKGSCVFKHELWLTFIRNSIIPMDYSYSGLCYGGYIIDYHKGWCLPSWIWTNGAIARLFCRLGEKDVVAELAEIMLRHQLDNGAWLVRLDYRIQDIVPVCAPNDSAYIAANVMLEAYEFLGKQEYLESAKFCADWVMKSSREDGLVSTAFDLKKREWTEENIIVDIGFTAVLFAKLIQGGHDESGQYRIFLDKFIAQFVRYFYNPDMRLFHTSLNSKYQGEGGYFARGQAWALEGLIAAYITTPNQQLKNVIDSTIRKLLELQRKDGSWHYNLTKRYLGLDGKGAPVIARSLISWHKIYPDFRILNGAEKALRWCERNTSLTNDDSLGGIFTFSMEGAIVHNHYSNATMVYSSAYAYEAYLEISQL